MTKELDTLPTRCALAGVALRVSQDDRVHVMFIASRWAMTRTFSILEEVAQWLAHVSGNNVGSIR